MLMQPEKLIYLDTMMWNRLADQSVDPVRLINKLHDHQSGLALSELVLFELARTFKTNPRRGCVLFGAMKLYTDSGITAVYDNLKQLHSEVALMNGYANGVVVFYSPADYALMCAEIDKLSQGIVDERAKSFIAGREEFAKSSRTDQRAHTTNTPEVADRLRGIPKAELGEWLDSEVQTDTGRLMLAGHMMRPFEGKLSEALALQNASALLAIPQSRMAKSLVKADLYYNWRCANGGSVPSDLIADMYHVVNAAYCHVYATAEDDQTKYASLLLTDSTKVVVYDELAGPIDEWLIQVAGKEEPRT